MKEKEASARCSRGEATADRGRRVFGETGWKSSQTVWWVRWGWRHGDLGTNNSFEMSHHRITVPWWNFRKVLPVPSPSLPSFLPPLQDRTANRCTDFAGETRTRKLAGHNVSSALSKISLVITIPPESQGTPASGLEAMKAGDALTGDIVLKDNR